MRRIGRRIGSFAVIVTIAIIDYPLNAEQASITRYEITQSGNEARYRVREQLVGINFPSDAIGVTSAIRGAVVLDAAGKVIPGDSKIIVDVSGLKSDQDRRDGYVRGRVLETEKFRTVDLAITELRGLTYPLPAAGEHTFQLIGALTVRGVTKPSVWQVTAVPRPGGLSGKATTSFTFADFGLTKPQVMSVLSVDDRI